VPAHGYQIPIRGRRQNRLDPPAGLNGGGGFNRRQVLLAGDRLCHFSNRALDALDGSLGYADYVADVVGCGVDPLQCVLHLIPPRDR
jgi:hypothetical protein